MLISVDFGGTNTRVASSKNGVDIHKIEKFPTKRPLDEQKLAIKNAIETVLDGEDVQYICLGVPGLVDRKERKFKKIVNYPELTGLYFEDVLDLPKPAFNLFVENDASLAGLGEAVFGEGQEFNVVTYITLSTGVGGIRIEGKEIDSYQSNSEPGHMILVENGLDDPVCGQKGCAHSYLSGHMFEKTHGILPEECDDEKIWKEYGEHLATMVINIIAMWAPEVIVFGGAVSEKFSDFKPFMEKSLSQQDLFEIPEIRTSQLKDINGVMGGFSFIKQNITN